MKTRNMMMSCRAPVDGAHRKGCHRGRMSTAGGVQGKDCCVRRMMCTTEGNETVKNCVTLHVLLSSKAEDILSVTLRSKSNYNPGNGNVQIHLCIVNISKFFLCDIEK
jgi:hypothetical protein